MTRDAGEGLHLQTPGEGRASLTLRGYRHPTGRNSKRRSQPQRCQKLNHWLHKGRGTAGHFQKFRSPHCLWLPGPPSGPFIGITVSDVSYQCDRVCTCPETKAHGSPTLPFSTRPGTRAPSTRVKRQDIPTIPQATTSPTLTSGELLSPLVTCRVVSLGF